MRNIYLAVIVILLFSCCLDVNIDFKKSEINGNLIAHAIEEYHKNHNEYPDVLEQLVPEYLSNIPNVEFKNRLGVSRENMSFLYEKKNIIPKYGCYIIEFDHKLTSKKFRYDSRQNKFEWTNIIINNPDYIEISISFDEVRVIINALDVYFLQNKHYPEKLEMLIPEYLESFPFNMDAKYRPYDVAPNFESDIFNYTSFQPDENIRGNFTLYFNVDWGSYQYMGEDQWYYDD